MPDINTQPEEKKEKAYFFREVTLKRIAWTFILGIIGSFGAWYGNILIHKCQRFVTNFEYVADSVRQSIGITYSLAKSTADKQDSIVIPFVNEEKANNGLDTVSSTSYIKTDTSITNYPSKLKAEVDARINKRMQNIINGK